MSAREEAVEELIASPPPFNWHDGGPRYWGLHPAVLRWIADHVPAGGRTLETGCGASSILLALKAERHTVVAPWDRHHALARKWLEERELPTDSLESVVALSQDALPRLEPDQLDLGLIDGGHAFPVPFIDWYYIGRRLRVGGHLVVDDTQVRPCGLLCDFLRQEQRRWRQVDQVRTTAMFVKLSDVLVPPDDWVGQPWSHHGLPAPTRLGSVRAAVRLRTRFRAARARLARQRSA